jgi:hypothetical protein
MRASYLAIALGLSFGFVTPSAHAQPPRTSYDSQPAVSPYLNLLRPGTNQATNYYGLVRPQIDTRNSIQSLQSQVNDLSAGSSTDAVGTELSTGHAVQFMNTSKYFGRTASMDKTGRTTQGGSGRPKPSGKTGTAILPPPIVP